jgi:uncharacterized protein DUF1579
MVKRVLGTSLVVLGVGGRVLAQPQAPKPGPEHKALGYFVGKWTSEGEMKPGPLGPGGKVTSTDSCEWFKGNFQVVCRGEGTGPMGPMTSLGVLAYSAADKAYTFYGIDNTGMGELSHGQKKGSTWIYTATSNIEGKQFQSRYTIVETSPTTYTFTWEMSTDKKTWSVALEGKATKAS